MERTERSDVAAIEIFTHTSDVGWWGIVRIDGVEEYLHGPELTLAQANAQSEGWLRQRAVTDERVARALEKRELRRAAERAAFYGGRHFCAVKTCPGFSFRASDLAHPCTDEEGAR